MNKNNTDAYPAHKQKTRQRERGEGEADGGGGTTTDNLSGMQYQKFWGRNLKKQLLIYSPGIMYI